VTLVHSNELSHAPPKDACRKYLGAPGSILSAIDMLSTIDDCAGWRDSLRVDVSGFARAASQPSVGFARARRI
jgi:hypothetical protein